MKTIKVYGYEVREDGTIISLRGKPMAFNKTISLMVDGKEKSVSYARFVYYAFHQNDFDFGNHKFCVKHKDNNNKNNRISNLYVTNKRNHLRGENNSRVKLTDKQIEEIREIYSKNDRESKGENLNNPFRKVSYRKLAEKYGVSHNLIKEIVRGGYRDNGEYLSK